MSRLCRWLGIAGLLLLAGCGSPSQLNKEYGRMTNLGQSGSINGTRVFAEMFRQRGATVGRQKVLSPKLERCQTIVWFPNRHIPPEEEVTEWLDGWVKRGDDRTLIYVGRDFDANMSYLREVRDSAEPANQEELQRLVSEAIVERHQDSEVIRDSHFDSECNWFTLDFAKRKKVNRLRGPLAQGIDARNVDIELATRLLPPKDRDVERLLSTDGHPFAYSILPQGYSTGKLIVVTNGSFLLNFGLIHLENRKLANNLIDLCDTSQRVVFLESGPGELPARTDNDPHQPWAWITQPPLRYIVPHLLFWGVLFCFVYFPIFGRARRFRVKERNFREATVEGSDNDADPESLIHQSRSTTSFRSHIVALARMLQRTESVSTAKEKVRTYQENFGKDSLFQ